MSEIDDLFARVPSYREAIIAAENAAKQQIERILRQRYDLLVQHISRVIRNNPSSSISDLLSRQDIRESLARVVSRETLPLQRVVREAWRDGARLGRAHVQAELDALQLSFPDTSFPRETAYLRQLLDDVQRNLQESIESILRRVIDEAEQIPIPLSIHQDPVSGVVNVPVAHAARKADRAEQIIEAERRRRTLRIGMSGTVAVTRSYTEAQQIVYGALEEQGMEVYKIWISRLDARVCPTCRRLHGVIRRIDEEFPYDSPDPRAPRVYLNLFGPPRHIGCRCVLFLFVRFPGEQDTPVETLEQARRVIADVPPLMTSQEVREMPQRRFESLRAVLRSVISFFRRLRRRRGPSGESGQ